MYAVKQRMWWEPYQFLDLKRVCTLGSMRLVRIINSKIAFGEFAAVLYRWKLKASFNLEWDRVHVTRLKAAMMHGGVEFRTEYAL